MRQLRLTRVCVYLISVTLCRSRSGSSNLVGNMVGSPKIVMKRNNNHLCSNIKATTLSHLVTVRVFSGVGDRDGDLAGFLVFHPKILMIWRSCLHLFGLPMLLPMVMCTPSVFKYKMF
jgi:hypothetical protein